jgi:predicted RNA-binding Zn ribbon-like protein
MENRMEALNQIKFGFISGYDCLDFLNTQIIHQGQTIDRLKDFDHLIAWLHQAGFLDPAQAEKALQAWGNSIEGEEILEQAKMLRRTLREMVERFIADQEIDPATIAEINRLLRAGAGYLQLVVEDHGYATHLKFVAETPMDLLSPLAAAAAGMLSQADLSLIKQCDNPDCIRFFYDSTKNHSRRWCDMDTCGNRMKVAAYYARKRRGIK